MRRTSHQQSGMFSYISAGRRVAGRGDKDMQTVAQALGVTL